MLGAQEAVPAEGAERVGGEGGEQGGEEKRGGKCFAEVGEGRPVDREDEPGDEDEREDGAERAAEGRGEEGGEAREHEGGVGKEDARGARAMTNDQ